MGTPRSSGGYTIHRPDHPIFAGTDLVIPPKATMTYRYVMKRARLRS